MDWLPPNLGAIRPVKTLFLLMQYPHHPANDVVIFIITPITVADITLSYYILALVKLEHKIIPIVQFPHSLS